MNSYKMNSNKITAAGCILFAKSFGSWYMVVGKKLSGASDKFIGKNTHFTGKINPGETCYEAAIRETKEETGYRVNKFFDRFKYTGIEFKSVSGSGIVGMTYIMIAEIDNLGDVLNKCGDISEVTQYEISRMVAVPIDIKLNGNDFYLKQVLEQGVYEFKNFLSRKDSKKEPEEKKDFLTVTVYYTGRTSTKKIVLCSSLCGVQFWTENGIISGGFKIEKNILYLSRTRNTLDAVKHMIGFQLWDNGKWYKADIIS